MNDVRPVSLDDIIGQKHLIQKSKILIQSAKQRNDALPHILYTGPPGIGKTTFARAIANDMGVKVSLQTGSSLRNIKDVIKVVRGLKKAHILFIDEIHRLKPVVAEFLYTIMEDFRYDIVDDYKSRSVDLPKITILGGTTIAGNMPDPLKGRFKHIEEFEEYSDAELVDISKRVAKIHGFKLSTKVAQMIAGSCKGNPRQIVSRTEWIRDCIQAHGIVCVSTDEKVESILLQQGVTLDGLDKNDVKYLKFVEEEGLASLKTIASALDLEPSTIINDIEPYLIKKGFIRIGKKGRYIANG